MAWRALAPGSIGAGWARRLGVCVLCGDALFGVNPHAHPHPRQSTAERYHLGHGVPLDRMVRTDRGVH
jgi:hypothetical protein